MKKETDVNAEDETPQLTSTPCSTMSPEAERIVAAAIRQDGVIYTGTRHGFIIRDIVLMTGIKPVTGQQGFVTSTGDFVSREIARDIALRAGQIPTVTHSARQLFSEDVWDIPEGGLEFDDNTLKALLSENSNVAGALPVSPNPVAPPSDTEIADSAAQEISRLTGQKSPYFFDIISAAIQRAKTPTGEQTSGIPEAKADNVDPPTQNALPSLIRYLPWVFNEHDGVLALGEYDGHGMEIKLGWASKEFSRIREITEVHNAQMARLVKVILSEKVGGSPASSVSSPSPGLVAPTGEAEDMKRLTYFYRKDGRSGKDRICENCGERWNDHTAPTTVCPSPLNR